MNNEQRTEEITVKVTRTAEGVTLTLPAEFASATVAVEPEPWSRWRAGIGKAELEALEASE